MIFASALFRLRLTAAQHLLYVREAIAPHLAQGDGKGDRTTPRTCNSDRQHSVHLNISAILERRESLQTDAFSVDGYRQALAKAIAVQGYNIKRKSLPERNVIWVGSGVERLRRSGSVPQADFIQVFDGTLPSTTERLRLGIAPAQPKRSR
jgi:hypothetical protein